jgi:hypothetical protein
MTAGYPIEEETAMDNILDTYTRRAALSQAS